MLLSSAVWVASKHVSTWRGMLLKGYQGRLKLLPGMYHTNRTAAWPVALLAAAVEGARRRLLVHALAPDAGAVVIAAP